MVLQGSNRQDSLAGATDRLKDLDKLETFA